jgi:trehalose 6-phosphate synthase
VVSQVLLASNRGPVSFRYDESGRLLAARGGGGLVSGLSGLSGPGGDSDATLWVCAALTDADRWAVREGAGGGCLDRALTGPGPAVRMLDLDPMVFDRAYNSVANRTLWFISHLLYAAPLRPSFGPGFARDWQAYRSYNAAFATALAEQAAPGAAVLVQDYHLSLVPAMLRSARPDLRIGHFSHTPWAPPDYFAILPDPVAAEILAGILGADSAGFLTERWARAFAACCARLPGATVHDDGLSVTLGSHTTRLAVHPLGVDAAALRRRGAEPDVAVRAAALRELLAGRRLLLRVDRTELSKNIVRGLHAYRDLLRDYPGWRGKVVHLAFAYPSRHDLPEYREYTAEVQRVAGAVNDEFATPGWRPLHLEVSDDYPRSLAAMRMADVVVVNPIRDGMNLVAKEAPVLSEQGVGLVLSREAGAVAELGADSFVVNPFDISETTTALDAALRMPPAQRLAATRRLAAAAGALPPDRWLARLLAELDAAG